MRRALKVYAARALAVAVSLLLVAALGEVWARATQRAPASETSAPPPPELRGLPPLETMRELAQPGVRGRHMGQVHRTNSYGLRGPEWALEAAPGTLRIGVGGDSVTMGWGVGESQRYSDRLGPVLADSAEGPRFEVINTGLAGLNATQAIKRLLHFDEIYGFDVLVYGFTPNDVEGPHYVHLGPKGGHGARFARLTRARDSPSHLWRFVWPRLVTLYEQLSPTEVTLEEELTYNILENEAAWAQIAGGLDLLADASVARGRCALVLLHTPLTNLGPFRPLAKALDKVAAAAESRGLVVVPTFDAFAGRYGPSLWVAPFDAHPNAVAHALLAERLADGVRTLPATCFAAGPP